MDARDFAMLKAMAASSGGGDVSWDSIKDKPFEDGSEVYRLAMGDNLDGMVSFMADDFKMCKVSDHLIPGEDYEYTRVCFRWNGIKVSDITMSLIKMDENDDDGSSGFRGFIPWLLMFEEAGEHIISAYFDAPLNVPEPGLYLIDFSLPGEELGLKSWDVSVTVSKNIKQINPSLIPNTALILDRSSMNDDLDKLLVFPPASFSKSKYVWDESFMNDLLDMRDALKCGRPVVIVLNDYTSGKKMHVCLDNYTETVNDDGLADGYSTSLVVADDFTALLTLYLKKDEYGDVKIAVEWSEASVKASGGDVLRVDLETHGVAFDNAADGLQIPLEVYSEIKAAADEQKLIYFGGTIEGHKMWALVMQIVPLGENVYAFTALAGNLSIMCSMENDTALIVIQAPGA